MQYSIQGFERIKVEIPGPKLLVDNVPVPQGAKPGEYSIHNDDGTITIIKLQQRLFEPVPEVIINDQKIRLVAPLRWYQWLWAGLPFMLAFIGGVLGMAISFLAFMINIEVFRSDRSKIGQYSLIGLISVGAVVFYFVAVMFFLSI